MNYIALLVLCSGILILMLSNVTRSSLPALVSQQGRDTSERRKAAVFHLRTLWLVRVTALIVCGASASLLINTGFLFSLWIDKLIIVLVVIIVGEILPSWLGHRYPDATTVLSRPFLSVVKLIIALPVRILLGSPPDDDSTADEWITTPPDILWLEQRKDKGNAEDYDQEQELIDSIVNFSDKLVREVMVPRIDMVCVELKDDFRMVVMEVQRAGHSRIPVYKEKIDEIVGILHAKDLLGELISNEKKPGMKDILREAYFVPEYKRIDDLFRELQIHRIQMAIVVDEYGGTAGLVTIEDLIEEVFGEIQDEFDTETPLVQSLGRGSFRVDARLSVDDLNDLLGTSYESIDYETLGGIVYQALCKIPRPGETVDISGYRFIVEKVRRQRILLVKILPLSPEVEIEDN